MTGKKTKIALIGGIGLGDTLIQMVLAYNAQLADIEITVFSNIICQLKNWFPYCTIKPTLAEKELNSHLAEFEMIFSPAQAPSVVTPQISHRWIYYEENFDYTLTMVENLARASQTFLGIDTPSRENGIQIPENLKWRHHKNRVVLHPTSAFENKNWKPQKFMALAHRIKQQNLSPVIIMSQPELAQWEPIVDGQFPLHGFPGIDECAAFIYESGFFIGNDSGGGHLAANLNIPTLSIHGRKSKSQTWRPGWGTTMVVVPPVNLIGGYLRQRYWNLFLSVNRVEKSFWKLFQLDAEHI